MAPTNRDHLRLRCVNHSPGCDDWRLEGSEFLPEEGRDSKVKLCIPIFFIFKRVQVVLIGWRRWQLPFTAQLYCSSDLGQMSSKMERACIFMCVCVSPAGLFGERSALIGTGRQFVELYCHMPLPIQLLIRAAITGRNKYAQLARRTHALRSSSLCV